MSPSRDLDLDSLVVRVTEKVDAAVRAALACASQALARAVRYTWGAKGAEALDCSGLVVQCYGSSLLPDGADRQCEYVRPWLLDHHLGEAGDLLFLSEQSLPDSVSHVGIVLRAHAKNLTIVHASGRVGHVTSDVLQPQAQLFRNEYVIRGVGKMRPWLFRYLLEQEVRGKGKDQGDHSPGG